MAEREKRERLVERLLDSGACTCTWAVNPAEDGPESVVVDPDPDCLAHALLAHVDSLERQVERYEKALHEIDSHIGLRADEGTQAEIRRVVVAALGAEHV